MRFSSSQYAFTTIPRSYSFSIFFRPARPMARLLSRELGITVFIDNDVNMAAKGELWRGQGRAYDSFAFLAMGTGIGMGIVADRRIVRGAAGGAGEIASLPIGGDPFDSRNFSSGTLESAISSAAIMDRYRAYGGVEARTVEDIFDRMLAGESAATAVIDAIAPILAQAARRAPARGRNRWPRGASGGPGAAPGRTSRRGSRRTPSAPRPWCSSRRGRSERRVR